MNFIATIRPEEKLQGYQPPSTPSTWRQLIADLKQSLKGEQASLNTAVWKVRIEKHGRCPRRLLVEGKAIRCRVIGATGHWWFVAVNATDALASLSKINSI